MCLIKCLTILLCLTALFACNQPQLPPDQYTLLTVNDKPLPMLLIDQVMQDPNSPPYRFRLEVSDGWFKLNGNQYEQSIGFYETAEGYLSRRWRWREFGTCTADGASWRCESGYIQNYVFKLTRQGNALVTEQEFKDPALKGTYSFIPAK